MTAGGWTADGEPAAELAAGQLVATLVSVAREVLPGVPVVVGGSLGRGEARVRSDGTWDSDVEAYLVTPSPLARQRIHRVGRLVEAKHPASISTDWLTPRRWQTLASRNLLARAGGITLQMYDLGTTGRVVSGILPSPRVPTANDIAPDEALRLVFNRSIELAEVRSVRPEAVDRWARKLIAAAIDRSLIASGHYASTLRGRIDLLGRFPEGVPEGISLEQARAVLEDLLLGSTGSGTGDHLLHLAVQLARRGIELETVDRLGWSERDPVEFAEHWLDRMTTSSFLAPYAVAMLPPGLAQNVTAILRHPEVVSGAFLSRTAASSVIWSTVPALLVANDPQSSSSDRARALGVVNHARARLRLGTTADVFRLWRKLA